MAAPLRAVLVGCGNRGRMFGELSRRNPKMIRIVSIADARQEWREAEARRNRLPSEAVFASFEEALSPSAPAADVALIATNDRTHHAATVAALAKGCHVLLEKPVAHGAALAVHLALLARRTGRRIAVQHELRYSPFFQEVRRLVRDGAIGQVYSYTHTEHVEFWHMTHSFVRGNWNNSNQENPMILAKCCHDLDLMPWILSDEVTKVSSFGRLDHFTRANKPAGSPERCTDGGPVKDCIHDAAAFYLGPCTTWPVSVLGPDFSEGVSMDERRQRLAASPYSRCAYNGHNNVVDHQSVMLETRRGTICTLTMQGFSSGEECGRKLRLDGTHGTIRGDMGRGTIMLYRHWHGPFGTRAEPEIIDLKKAGLDGHGGGDERLFKHVIECFWKGDSHAGEEPLTTIDESVESHLLAWAAEEARLEGKVVQMDEFRRRTAAEAEAMLGR